MNDDISVDLRFDRGQAFQLFAVYCGDIERTAASLNVRAVDILKVAEQEGWLEKLKPIIELSKSAKKGDIEKSINRALNFCQAHRMRLVIERVISKISAFTDDEIEDYIFSKTSTKDGAIVKSLTTRALADLSSALEKCQAMTYLALNDGTQARLKREEKDDGSGSAGEMHARIAAAMSKVRESSTPRAQLFDAQIEIGQSLAKEASKPVNVPDSEDYNARE